MICRPKEIDEHKISFNIAEVRNVLGYSKYFVFGFNLGFNRIMETRPVLMMFTHSGIISPKVNRFGRNLGHSEYILVGAWSWQILGAIRAVARAGEPGEIFCQVSNAQFYRFPVGQISRNLNTIRRSVPR